MRNDIKLIVLGSDIHSYNLARAFHEAYGQKTIVLGKVWNAQISESAIIEFEMISDWENVTLLNTLDQLYNRLNKQYKHIILLGNWDGTVRFLLEHREQLEDRFVIPYAPISVLDQLLNKNDFYALCEKYDIPHPKTVILKKGMPLEVLDALQLPIIVKPSDSVSYGYFRGSHANINKVYQLSSKEDIAKAFVADQLGAYDGDLIVQEYIAGDENDHDLHIFLDTQSKVRVMNLGHVLIGDPSKKMTGNNIATLTIEPRPELEKIKQMVESIGVVGWVDADLRLDTRDNTLKLFEINARAGRSNYRVTASGFNIMKYYVDAFIDGIEMSDTQYAKAGYLWHVIPFDLVRRIVKIKNPELAEKLKDVVKNKRNSRSFKYDKDNALKRKWLLFKKDVKYYLPFLKGEYHR